MAIRLDPEDLNALRRLQAAIEAHQLVLDNLRYALVQQVQNKYGVNLANESWVLYLELGILEQVSEAGDDTDEGR